MRAILLAVMLTMGAGAAQAQTTSCGMELGRWVCRSQQPQPQANPMAAFERGRQQAYDQAQQQQDERNAKAGAAFMDALTSAVREGRCEDAKNIALDANRLDLADQAARGCVARN